LSFIEGEIAINNLIVNFSYWSTRFQIRQLALYNGGLPITSRPFSYYRRVFFDDRSPRTILASLQGKKVVDIGCGYSPYSKESMFRACYDNEIEFYGVDPVLTQSDTFRPSDVLLARLTGGTGKYDINAPGLGRAIPATANQLPFFDNTIDMILSCWFIPIWIDTEEELLADFSEIYRILKIGGTISLYPLPDWNSFTIKNPQLTLLLDKFEFSQRFIYEPFNLIYPPTNRLTLTKTS
jgi:SAM-dependent methyltransferase